MSAFTEEGPSSTARRAVALAGLISAVAGVIILVWPSHAAEAIAVVIAIYAIIAGLVYIVAGVLSKALGAGGRIGHVLLGLLYLVAGCFAFSQLGQTAAFLGVFVAIMIGVMWVMEGFVSLLAVSTAKFSVITVVFAIVSILAGLSLLSSPLWGAAFLWWYLGISLVVLGLLNAFRAMFGRKG